MDVVTDWSQRFARRLAPTELPLVAEVSRRYVAGGAERRRLYRADGEDTGGFGASLGGSDVAVVLDAVRQAADQICTFLNTQYPGNLVAIGTVVWQGVERLRAGRVAPAAPLPPSPPAPPAPTAAPFSVAPPLLAPTATADSDGLSVTLSDQGQMLLAAVIESLELALGQHDVPVERAEELAAGVLLVLAADPVGARALLNELRPDLATPQAHPGPTFGPVAHPPWLWVYLVAALALALPQNLSGLLDQLRTYRAIPVGPLGGATMLQLTLVAGSLPVLFLLAGVASVALPGWRGRRVEARHRLGLLDPDHDMHQFVCRIAPDVEIRTSADAGRGARVYPVSWRRARIGVFLPLLRLWDDDRPAAEAALLHELAHVRQGEHLIIGLGSPFGRLLRVWAPIFVALSLLPTAYLLVSGNPLAEPLTAQLLLDATAPARILIFPVAAIWLAELAADSWAVDTLGSPDPLLRALDRQQPRSFVRRAVRLLDHPPLGVRRWAARARPTVVLLLAWPTITLVKLALVIIIAVPAFVLNGQAAELGPELTTGVRVALTTAVPLMAGSVTLLLGWPWLATWWARRWRPARPSTATRPDGATRRLNRRDYLKAAILPALLLAAAGVWPSGAEASDTSTPGTPDTTPAADVPPGSTSAPMAAAPVATPAARANVGNGPGAPFPGAPVGLFATARIVSFQQVSGRPEWVAAALANVASAQWTFGQDHSVSFTAPQTMTAHSPAVGRLSPGGFTAATGSSTTVGTVFTEVTGTIAPLPSGAGGQPERVLIRFRWSSGVDRTATVNNQTFRSATRADYDVVAELTLTH